MSVNQHVLVDLLGRDGALLGRGKWLVEYGDRPCGLRFPSPDPPPVGSALR